MYLERCKNLHRIDNLPNKEFIMYLPLGNQLARQYRILLFCIALILSIFIAICDYQIRENISFYVLYSIPIFIAGWFIGRWAGLTISFASSLAWALVDFKNNEATPAILYVDSLLRLIFFSAMSFVISYLR
jgi:hypothetical protein